MDAYDQLRDQIKATATSKYPQMQNFTLSNAAIKKFMREHRGNINSIVDELYKIVGVGKPKPKSQEDV